MVDQSPPWDSTRVVPREPDLDLSELAALLSRIEAEFQRPAILGPVSCQSCLRPVVLTELDGLWLNAGDRSIHAPPCGCGACDCSYAVCDPEGVGVPLCHPCEEGEHLVG